MQRFFILVLQIYFFIFLCHSAAGEQPNVNGDAKHILDALARLEVPEQLINIGRWNENSFALLAEKSTQKLYLFDSSHNLIKTYQVTTGQNNGNKEKVGDKKTPEGVYFFTEVKGEKELLPKYGLLALPINYPNFFDRLDGKTGNGIWLHATDQPARPIKPFDTRGCIVVVNEDILELARHIKLQTTPLVIVDKIEFIPIEAIKEEDQKVREFLNKWRDSWEAKKLDEYMNSYSKSFKSRNMNWDEWKKYKASLNQINSERKISIRDVKILRQNEIYYVASLMQRYIGEGTNDTGIKRLYIEDTEDGMKIIGEEWNAMPKEDLTRIADKLSEKLHIKVAENTLNRQAAAVQDIRKSEADEQSSSREIKEKKQQEKEDIISIEDFKANTNKKRLKAKFHLVNKKGEDEKLQGRLAIIAFGDKKKTASSYPKMKLSNNIPKDFTKGEWYSIKRFKIVEGDLGENKGFKTIKIIVYSLKGEIILEKEFTI